MLNKLWFRSAHLIAFAREGSAEGPVQFLIDWRTVRCYHSFLMKVADAADVVI